MTLLSALLTGVSVALLLPSYKFEFRPGVLIFKPLASTGFILTAWFAGALESTYGTWVFIGLILGMGGDVCLMWRARAPFLAGIISFLLGHLAYVVAFAVRGIDLLALSLTAVAGVFVGWVVARWILPHAGALKAAVVAYIVVISTMVALAGGTVGLDFSWLILLGSVAFFLSDLSVARDRFVSQEFANKIWGVPLYFGAQLLIALTVAGAG